MKKTFALTIRTPEGEVYNCQATGVRLEAEGGLIKVLAGHASITATIVCTPVIVEGNDFSEEFFARQGVFFFDNRTNTATLMAIYCERRSEVNAQTVEEYLKFIEEQLAAGKGLSEFQVAYLEGEKIAVKRQLQVKQRNYRVLLKPLVRVLFFFLL